MELPTDSPERTDDGARYRCFHVTDRDGEQFLVIKDTNRRDAWIQSTYSVPVDR